MLKKITAGMLAVMVAFTFMPILGTANAAAKKPAKPTITKVTSTQTTVTTKWEPAKNAKKYQVQFQRDYKVWGKLKKVKKNSTNKKKYTRKNLYKVKAVGKKYQVYKYAKTHIYTTTRKNLTIKSLKSNQKYSVRVMSVNGNKKSSWSKGYSVITKKIDSIPIEKIKNGTVKFTEGYSYIINNIKYKAESVDNDGSATLKGTDNSTIRKTSDGLYEYNTDLWAGSELYREGVSLRKNGITVYYAIDGTEPKIGQEDAYDEMGDQIKGTITKKGFTRFDKPAYTLWVKAYYKNKLIYERKY